MDPADPKTRFRCEAGGGDGPPCTLSYESCVGRQDKRSKWGKPVHKLCGSGTCEQGQLVRLALRGERATVVREPEEQAPRERVCRACGKTGLRRARDGVLYDECEDCRQKARPPAAQPLPAPLVAKLWERK